MKKCPFCSADIEDNARFCLYCMKELDEKTFIKNKVLFFTRRNIIIFSLCVAVLLSGGIAAAIVNGLHKKPDGNFTNGDSSFFETPSSEVGNAYNSDGNINSDNGDDVKDNVGVSNENSIGSDKNDNSHQSQGADKGTINETFIKCPNI